MAEQFGGGDIGHGHDPDLEPTHQDAEGNPAPPGHRETTENQEAEAEEKVAKINQVIYDYLNEGDLPMTSVLNRIEKIIHG